MFPENTNENTGAGKSPKEKDKELNDLASNLKKTDTPEKNGNDLKEKLDKATKDEKASK